MVAPFLGGHWSVVVPPVVSASPMRHCGRCYPRSRTVQAGDTIVPRKKKISFQKRSDLTPARKVILVHVALPSSNRLQSACM